MIHNESHLKALVLIVLMILAYMLGNGVYHIHEDDYSLGEELVGVILWEDLFFVIIGIIAYGLFEFKREKTEKAE